MWLAMTTSRCVGSDVSVQMCRFRCVGSDVSVQMCRFRCVGSDVSVQMCRFRCVGSDVSVQMCRFRCVGSDVSVQMCRFRRYRSDFMSRAAFILCRFFRPSRLRRSPRRRHEHGLMTDASNILLLEPIQIVDITS